MQLTSKYICPICGSRVSFKDGGLTDLMHCDKCEWEDSYTKANVMNDTNSNNSDRQEVYDCDDCGERYVTLPHDCKVLSPGTPPKLRVRYVPIASGGRAAERPAVGDADSQDRGTGARWNQDKPPMEFIPLHLLEETAEVFHLVTTRKIRPYPMWNWAKGMPWLVPYACLVRHLAAWFRGEEFDTGPNGSGKRHTAHMMCNLLMIIHYEQAYREGDNRPKKWFQPSEAGND